MEYFKIGKLVAAFGVKGELILKHSLGKKSALKGLDVVFTEERKNSFLPWFIVSAKVKNENEIFLQLESVNTREAALKLVQKEAWITEDAFRKHSAKSSPLNLLGFDIIHNKKNLGPVLELVEQPHQLLCRLMIDAREVLIPLNEHTVKKVDKKNRQIFVTLPDGLLEIYLG